MRRWLLPALVVWTAYVWVTRINNAWTDPVASTATKLISTVLALSLLVPAAVAAVGWWRNERTLPVPEPWARVVVGLCVWTTAVWLVRIPQIALANHDVPFKVVHGVLGLISIALAVAVFREQRERSVSPVDALAR